jgi:hypothetical protein
LVLDQGEIKEFERTEILLQDKNSLFFEIWEKEK